MKVIGLTGGIASGKSLVASMFHSLGAIVLSADEIGRRVEAPGTEVFKDIVHTFGANMVRADGSLDRKRLGDLIFRDANARARLNAITHSHIRLALSAEIDRLRAAGIKGVVIVEIPLLLDTAPRDAFPLDGVIVVAVDSETQIARLMARDGLTRGDALPRLKAQRPLAEKVAEADWVVDNSGPAVRTRHHVEDLWAHLHATPRGSGSG